jgi:hypothetical protein
MKPGTRVRFTADNLGALDPNGSVRFEGTVSKGETGVVADWEPGPMLSDWIGVTPDDHHDWLVPVHPSMIELVPTMVKGYDFDEEGKPYLGEHAGQPVVTVSMPGRVWDDFLNPDVSTMQAELGLPEPQRVKIGKGLQVVYYDVPRPVAMEVADYLWSRGDMLIGQSISDPYDPMEKAARDTLRAACKTAEKIRAL